MFNHMKVHAMPVPDLKRLNKIDKYQPSKRARGKCIQIKRWKHRISSASRLRPAEIGGVGAGACLPQTQMSSVRSRGLT
jgi:hypothetical protein